MWHVTYPEAVPLIEASGLLPRSDHDGPTNWSLEYAVVADCVYLNVSHRMADEYISFLRATYGDDCGVAVIRVDSSQLDPSRLVMDHEDIAYMLRDNWPFVKKHFEQQSAFVAELQALRDSCYDIRDEDVAFNHTSRCWNQLSSDTQLALATYATQNPGQGFFDRVMYRGAIAPEALCVMNLLDLSVAV